MNFFLNLLVLFAFITYFSHESIAKKEEAITDGLGSDTVVERPYDVGKARFMRNKASGFPIEEALPPVPVEEMPPLPTLEEALPPMPVEEMPPLPTIEEALPPLPMDEIQPFPSTEEVPSFPVIGEMPLSSAPEIAPIEPETKDMFSPNLTTEQGPSLAPTDENPFPSSTEVTQPDLEGTPLPETTPVEENPQLSIDNQSNIAGTNQLETQAPLEAQPTQEKAHVQAEVKQVAQAADQNQYQALALQKAQQRQIERAQLMEQQVDLGDSQNSRQRLQQQMSQEQFQREAIQRSEQRQANQILDAQEAAERQERERAQQKRERTTQQSAEKQEMPTEIAKADGKVKMEKESSKDARLINGTSKHPKALEYKEAQFASVSGTDEHGNSIDESESITSGKMEESSPHRQQESEEAKQESIKPENVKSKRSE